MATKIDKDFNLTTTETKSVTKAVDLQKRLLKIVGSDESIDRDGDQILLSAWDFDNYRKNPIVLWAHNYANVPLGAAQKITKQLNPKQLVFDIRFPTEGLNPFADMILNLYNEKILNASSVGFIPKEYKERKDKGRLSGKIFTNCELLELSLVPVPANPTALSLGMKQFKDEAARKSMKSLLNGESSNFGSFVSNSTKIVNELDGYKHNFVVVESGEEVPQPVVEPMAEAPEVKESIAAKILGLSLEDIFGEMEETAAGFTVEFDENRKIYQVGKSFQVKVRRDNHG